MEKKWLIIYVMCQAKPVNKNSFIKGINGLNWRFFFKGKHHLCRQKGFAFCTKELVCDKSS